MRSGPTTVKDRRNVTRAGLDLGKFARRPNPDPDPSPMPPEPDPFPSPQPPLPPPEPAPVPPIPQLSATMGRGRLSLNAPW
jgi:hypothetical protein